MNFKLLFLFIIFTSNLSFGAAPSCSGFVGYNLEALIDQAKELIRYDKQDANLSALITAVANKGIDVENMTSLQMDAFKIAGQIKVPPKKEWRKLTRFRKKPKTVDLGAFPNRGIESVTAHIVMLELTLNGKVQERLQGVTYEVSLVPGDERSSGLEAITEGKISTWSKANSDSAYRRRKNLIHILKEQFDSLSAVKNKRILHSVISLARSESDPGSYVLPTTQIDPLSAFSLENPELANEFNINMRSHFLATLSGERDVTVLTGYQNGNAANPARGRQ